MSSAGHITISQRPEHVVIREYLKSLHDARVITKESLRDAFVPAYLEMIPPGEDVPHFDAVHRLDSVDQMRRKDGANLKKLWRAIEGATFFPTAFRAPLVQALEHISPTLGVELEKRLLHNLGLYYLPIDVSDRAPAVYAEWLQEFAEANTQLVEDISDDGTLNSARSRKEVLDVIEKGLEILRVIDHNLEANG